MNSLFVMISNKIRNLINLKYAAESDAMVKKKGIDWIGSIPFLLFHLMCFGIIWVKWSLFSVLFALFFYIIRMFSITAFYHRYFSHRAFKANRLFSFIFAFLGCSAMQRGPLWWAAIHRHHHRFADTEQDIHSPIIRGFWWSHIGWILAFENKRTRVEYINDLLKFPELIILDKLSLLVPITTGVFIYLLGTILETMAPGLHTNGMQLLIWGSFVSTVWCSHATFSINSIDHLFGKRRYKMNNASRNNWLMAILTLGEGWHNNHHHYAVTAKAGFYWWEIDLTYYLLKLFSWIGIVKNLRPISNEKREENKV